MTREELHEIVSDVSFMGKYTEFYEMLQSELDDYSDEQIEEMKSNIIHWESFTAEKINSFDKMRILYEYSRLL